VIVIDNTHTSALTLTGSWPTSTAVAGYWGANYLHDNNAGKGAKSVLYTTALPKRPPTKSPSGTRPTTAARTPCRSTSTMPGAPTRVRVNQRLNGGRWHVLGTFAFDPAQPARVRISNEGARGYVIADAVRFRFVAPAISPASTTATTPVVSQVNLLPDPLASPDIRVTGIRHRGEAVEVTWPTVAGALYELEQAKRLNAAWTVVAIVTGTGAPITVTLKLDDPPDQQSLLRLKVRADSDRPGGYSKSAVPLPNTKESWLANPSTLD
jgi:hypothetical protein